MRNDAVPMLNLGATSDGGGQTRSAMKRRRKPSYASKVTAIKMDNGAHVMTSPESLGKRESITLSTVPASKRHLKFSFTDSFSRLVSEIYSVCEAATNCLAGQYTLDIPVHVLPLTHYVYHVLHMPSVVPNKRQQQSTESANSENHQISPIVNEAEWKICSENVVFNFIGAKRHVTVSSHVPGLWMVVCTIKEEFFSVPTSGALFSSRLNRFVSCRFPKGAVTPQMGGERRYRHRVIPLPNDILNQLKEEYKQLSDLIVLSDVFDFQDWSVDGSDESGGDDSKLNYNRNATVRLPLPDLPRKLPERDCVWRIFHRPGPLKGNGWTMMDAPAKQITRTTLAFDIKRLGAYVVAFTISNLNPFLGNALTFVWHQSFVLHHWECVACMRAVDGVFWLAFNLARDNKHKEAWFARKQAKGYQRLEPMANVKVCYLFTNILSNTNLTFTTPSYRPFHF